MIHFFVGTKAQLIKVAPIMRQLQDRGIRYNFILSGQHRDTMGDILSNFGLVRQPDHVLYEGDDITGIAQMARWAFGILDQYRAGPALGKIFQDDDSGVVINHGDTISTLLGSWLARRHGLQNAHVESGLRSFNLFHPFPEELTRLLTFRLSDFYFAPGEWALNNLKRYPGTKINTGHNTLYDSLDHTPPLTHSRGKPYALVSIHRFENIFSKQRLQFIVDSLISSGDGTRKLFILHKPTEKKLKEYGLYERMISDTSIELHPRYDYFTFISLLKGAEYLISDGGSNQEESFYLGIPCLLMRKATERTEGLGHNVLLSGYDRALIHEFMLDYRKYSKPALRLTTSPSKLILDTLIDARLAD